MSPDKTAAEKTRVAILGARGIGAVHARVFRELGCEIAGIAGSSAASARQAADELASRLGIEVRAFGARASAWRQRGRTRW
jgi:predicted dehydrogenase